MGTRAVPAHEAELGGEERIDIRRETPVPLPLLLPGRCALLRIRVRDVRHARIPDRVFAHRREVVAPVEPRHEGDRRGVVCANRADDFLHHRPVLLPRQRAELAALDGLVEELVEPDHRVAGVTFGNLPPEVEGFRERGVVHVSGEALRTEVADRVPVDDHVHPQLARPLDPLVQQREKRLLATIPPPSRVNRDAHDVGVPGTCRLEVFAVPLPARLEPVRVGKGDTPEDDGLPGVVDEAVPVHAEERHRRALIRSVRFREGGRAGDRGQQQDGDRDPLLDLHGSRASLDGQPPSASPRVKSGIAQRTEAVG
jgi:hypothetical protein